jgi:hypothetical protein
MSRYIDADKFLDELDKQICSDCIDEDNHCCSCGVGSARAIAKDTPTADVVEVRHGEWEGQEFDDGHGFKYKNYWCSVCGRKLVGCSNPKDAPYCHCGAKMDGDRREG